MSQMPEQRSDSPGVIAFPPLLFGGTLAIGLILHFLAPVRPFPAVPARIVGALLLVGSAALAKWGERPNLGKPVGPTGCGFAGGSSGSMWGKTSPGGR